MTNEEMKSELNRSLEFWNRTLIAEQKRSDDYTTFMARISGKMDGMIDFAHNAKIISDAEKVELEYIYFEEPVLRNLAD